MTFCLKPKLINITTFVLLVVIQLWLLCTAIWGNISNPLPLLILSAVTLLVIPAYFELLQDAPCKPIPVSKDSILILAVAGGAVVAYVLSVYIGLGAVIGSALVGVAASYLPRKFPAAIYCGSFVGMSSTLVLGNFWIVGLAGLLAGLVFIFAQNIFKGVGGKLGTIAFVGSVLTTTFLNLWK